MRLLLPAMLVLPLLLTGCGADSSPSTSATTDDPGDPGTPRATPTAAEATPTPVPEVTPAPVSELEPNGWEDAATTVGGSGTWTFEGVCADGGDVDLFRVMSAGGVLDLRLTWDEGAMASDLDLLAFTSQNASLAADTAFPPGDSPSEIAAAIDAPADVFIQIDCYNNLTPNVSYRGTITVP